jgi:Domain of unknown function (DUF4345)
MTSTALTLFVAVVFALMGGLALTKPGRILAPFGVHSLAADGRNEVRAVYGGFGIAISLLLTATLWHESIRPGVLTAVAAALLGMAAGRVASAAIDRTLGRSPRIFFVVEVVLAVMLLAAR